MKSYTVAFRCSIELRAELDRLASDQSLSRSAMICRLLSEALTQGTSSAAVDAVATGQNQIARRVSQLSLELSKSTETIVSRLLSELLTKAKYSESADALAAGQGQIIRRISQLGLQLNKSTEAILINVKEDVDRDELTKWLSASSSSVVGDEDYAA